MEQEDGARVSIAYLRFAEDEVRDKSPLYCELLRGAASDPEVIGFLLTLPREKRQPNLFLAAARHLFGTPAGWDQLQRRVLQDKDALRAVMLARSSQHKWASEMRSFIARADRTSRAVGPARSRRVCRSLPAPRLLRP